MAGLLVLVVLRLSLAAKRCRRPAGVGTRRLATLRYCPIDRRRQNAAPAGVSHRVIVHAGPLFHLPRDHPAQRYQCTGCR